jgi:hypothetical protein
MNFPIPLLALLMANRLGDSSSDAGRIALMSMMIRPPMMGLLIAMVMAKQAAKPAPVSNNSTGVSVAGRQGGAVFDQVAPRHGHLVSFFPTFVDLTRKQATQLAKELGLSTKFVDTRDGSGKEVVRQQDPPAGANWPHGATEVTLILG